MSVPVGLRSSRARRGWEMRKARTARFEVFGRFDGCGAPQRGTVTIHRETGLIEVRPYRRHRTYAALLSTVAEIVVQRTIRAEVAAQRAAKKAAARKS